MVSNFCERFSVLSKAYKVASRENLVYTKALGDIAKYREQLAYIENLQQSLKILYSIIVEKENEWQDTVLRILESEIAECLSFVYPADGYYVTLSTRILRGKVHIESMVNSYFLGQAVGDISEMQGRLFQQIVSFAALIALMKILGVDTVYIDEAFSGAAKENVEKINRLLRYVQESGKNLVLIAQDTSMAKDIKANVLFLTRSLDNKTSVIQQEEENSNA